MPEDLRLSDLMASRERRREPHTLATVVRTQGSPAGHVAIIASRKRAGLMRDFLRGEGFGPDALARLRAPAGLDLGARLPEEIALFAMAEIVMRRRGGSGAPRDAGTARRPAAPALMEAAP